MLMFESLRRVNCIALRRASAHFGIQRRVVHVVLVVERGPRRFHACGSGGGGCGRHRLGTARRFENRLGIGQANRARADQTQQTSLLMVMVKIGRAIA